MLKDSEDEKFLRLALALAKGGEICIVSVDLDLLPALKCERGGLCSSDMHGVGQHPVKPTCPQGEVGYSMRGLG